MHISFVSCVILSTNALLIVISVYWTISSWRHISSLESQQPWLKSNCTIESSAIENESDTPNYRNIFSVSAFGCSPHVSPSPSNTADAYRYGTSKYNQTKEQAEVFAEQFQLESTYSCYVICFLNRTDDDYNFKVSMTPVSTGATSTELEIAIISTTFTAIACLVLLILFIYFLLSDTQYPWAQSNDPLLYPNPLTTNTTGRQPSSVVRPLSREQIDAICNTHISDQDDEKLKKSSGPLDVCSICLEDDDHGPQTQLPCQHVFHTACVRSWLMRGGVTCPLCCTQLADSFKNDDEHKREHDSQSSTTHVVHSNNNHHHHEIVAVINNEQHGDTDSNDVNIINETTTTHTSS